MNLTSHIPRVAVALRAPASPTCARANRVAISWPGQRVVRVAQRSGATGGHQEGSANRSVMCSELALKGPPNIAQGEALGLGIHFNPALKGRPNASSGSAPQSRAMIAVARRAPGSVAFAIRRDGAPTLSRKPKACQSISRWLRPHQWPTPPVRHLEANPTLKGSQKLAPLQGAKSLFTGIPVVSLPAFAQPPANGLPSLRDRAIQPTNF